jgi:hypothetical protein
LLWRRGESREEARTRLAGLAPDASAQRAARDTVHPLLATVEKLIPRPARQEFSLFMWAGWLDAKLVELPPQQAANPVTRRRFAEQWSESIRASVRRTPSRATSRPPPLKGGARRCRSRQQKTADVRAVLVLKRAL